MQTIFPVIYILILLPLLYAVGVFIEYFIRGDSKETRKKLPESFVFAAITSFLIVFWVFIYIAFMYDSDKVYVKEYDRYQNSDSESANVTTAPHDERI